MKKIFNSFILLFLLNLSSCNKWLDVELINMRTDAVQFSSENGFKEALAGVYTSMTSSSLYGQQLSFGVLDLMARIYDYGQVMANYRIYRDHDYSDSGFQSAIFSIWYSMYSNIASLNHILEWSDKTTADIDRDAMNRIKGEALALRAFHHFELYRLFAPNYKIDKSVKMLPLQIKYGVEAPDIVSTSDFLNSVIDDLNKAIKFLETDPIRNVKPYKLEAVSNKDMADVYVARMNYYAAKALLARVYNDMGGDYHQLARVLAQEVIESESFGLLDGDKSILVPIEKQDILFSDEHIFSLRSASFRETSNSLHKQFITTDGNLMMTPAFKSVIFNNDNEDYRLNWFNQLYIIKYNIDNTKFFFPKIPMIKLSEMYFIAAEGWMDDDPSYAAELMRKLRQSRTKTIINQQPVDIELIVKERRKDFLFEGSMFYTYKRLNHQILGNTSEDQVSPSNQVFVLPIPREEIEGEGR